MMSHEDTALSISNPRLLAAVYFALLAVIATCIIDSFLYFMGVEQFLPLFKAVLLAVVVAGCFGALFGKRIIHSKKPYRRKAFLFGFLMVLAALPFYVLGFLFLSEEYARWALTDTLSQQLLSYLFTLFYSFIIAGLWLAIAAGFAAMYLRGHLVYDILHSKYLRRQRQY
ncbi:hypothetical protein [Legionella hackeliae]|uniref:Transmembrane protein n=1 Tax=Legionella hackeliae TaxID=449 RepID=A0A0A8UM78_LEGHA|nr:hypothetical protein [Legionella hackeliae]KTD10471.1 hypothetical protein Lhac_2839 [Legionella hackeliae]CEK09975.1 conserved membrane protein of unknown function [Legionella hackeliae]STX49887.1 Uncharacterised protein [Legionella hackeliae]